jgi:hypothetical protein
MGLLLIGLVAGILIGYAMPAPTQANLQRCGSQICFDGTVPANPNATALVPDPATRTRNSVPVAKSAKRPRSNSSTQVAVAKNSAPNATEDRPSSAETSESVLSKAKMSVAAKLEDPATAEFSDMKRAMRKNMFGRPMDTICGHVRAKRASGEEIGEKPFLYLVKEDDAYVVEGRADSAAAIAYRNICH